MATDETKQQFYCSGIENYCQRFNLKVTQVIILWSIYLLIPTQIVPHGSSAHKCKVETMHQSRLDRKAE